MDRVCFRPSLSSTWKKGDFWVISPRISRSRLRSLDEKPWRRYHRLGQPAVQIRPRNQEFFPFNNFDEPRYHPN
jgi:hypothetical protein